MLCKWRLYGFFVSASADTSSLVEYLTFNTHFGQVLDLPLDDNGLIESVEHQKSLKPYEFSPAANLLQGPNSPDHEPLNTRRTRWDIELDRTSSPPNIHFRCRLAGISSMFLQPRVVAAKARRHSPYSMSHCSDLSPRSPHHSTVNLRRSGARPGRDLERSSLHARSSLGTLPCPVDSK